MRWEHAEAFHVLGGQAKNSFDLLFTDTVGYGQSGRLEALGFQSNEEPDHRGARR